MSATGRNLPGHERAEADFYATPPQVTRAILPFLEFAAIETALEPCAGDGAIKKAIEATGYDLMNWHGYELDYDRAEASGFAKPCDALEEKWPDVDLVITNPPFSLAEEFVGKAIVDCPSAEKVFLLRLAFLESKKRASFHRAYPSDVYVLPERPSFVWAYKCKNKLCTWSTMTPPGEKIDACPWCSCRHLQSTKSDMAAYAWFVWGPGRGGRWQVLEV